MLNLKVNWPRVISICVLAIVAISSFYLRLPQYSFITEQANTKQQQDNSPALLLSQVKMIRFNQDGKKHSSLIASHVKQFDKQETFEFNKPQLQLFAAQPWHVQSASATADTEQKEIIFSQKVTAKRGQTIIETPSLTVSQDDQKAYSNTGVIIRRSAIITSAKNMTIFFERPQILLNKQVKTRYVPASH